CFCNGAELCIEGVCTAGAAPCTDAIDCTTETCLEDSRECVFHADDAMCSDGDACNGAEVCDRVVGCRAAAPLYCNDEDSCTFDSCDPATGCLFSPRDLDGDGFTDGRCGGDDCETIRALAPTSTQGPRSSVTTAATTTVTACATTTTLPACRPTTPATRRSSCPARAPTPAPPPAWPRT
ncbi:MAG: hypothetical protein GW913_11505, partial [Myxococcales bacterium]|nr:hypothetical protein [Myxococcales bacterium]